MNLVNRTGSELVWNWLPVLCMPMILKEITALELVELVFPDVGFALRSRNKSSDQLSFKNCMEVLYLSKSSSTSSNTPKYLRFRHFSGTGYQFQTSSLPIPKRGQAWES